MAEVNHFPQNLRILRKKKFTSEDQAANSIGVTQQTYSNYETGRRTPTLETLIRIAAEFDVGLDELVLYEPETVENVEYQLFEKSLYGEGKREENDPEYSKEERELIRMFRSLSSAERKEMKAFVRDMLKKKRNNP